MVDRDRVVQVEKDRKFSTKKHRLDAKSILNLHPERLEHLQLPTHRRRTVVDHPTTFLSTNQLPGPGNLWPAPINRRQRFRNPAPPLGHGSHTVLGLRMAFSWRAASRRAVASALHDF